MSEALDGNHRNSGSTLEGLGGYADSSQRSSALGRFIKEAAFNAATCATTAVATFILGSAVNSMVGEGYCTAGAAAPSKTIDISAGRGHDVPATVRQKAASVIKVSNGASSGTGVIFAPGAVAYPAALVPSTVAGEACGSVSTYDPAGRSSRAETTTVDWLRTVAIAEIDRSRHALPKGDLISAETSTSLPAFGETVYVVTPYEQSGNADQKIRLALVAGDMLDEAYSIYLFDTGSDPGQLASVGRSEWENQYRGGAVFSGAGSLLGIVVEDRAVNVTTAEEAAGARVTGGTGSHVHAAIVQSLDESVIASMRQKTQHIRPC